VRIEKSAFERTDTHTQGNQVSAIRKCLRDRTFGHEQRLPTLLVMGSFRRLFLRHLRRKALQLLKGLLRQAFFLFSTHSGHKINSGRNLSKLQIGFKIMIIWVLGIILK